MTRSAKKPARTDTRRPPATKPKARATAKSPSPPATARHPKGGTAMSEQKPAAPESGGGDRNVDQIRDILFGGQMRDYERRFLELSQRLEQESARQRGETDKRLAALEKRLDDGIEKLARQLRQETADRGQSLDDHESRLLQALRTQRNEGNVALDQLRQDLANADERERQALAALESAFGDAQAQAERALSAAREELRGEKVSREDLSALFTEFALRLRGVFELPGAK